MAEILNAEILEAIGNGTAVVETSAGSPASADFATELKSRGPVSRPDGRLCVGRVGAPPTQEATSEEFCFWVPPDALVEKSQIVTCMSRVAGQKYTYYAIVDEVHRCSRKRSMGHEVDEADNDLDYEPPFESEGYTYATATILRVEPMALTPPRERSDVMMGNEADVEKAYSADEIAPGSRLAVGLVKNGGNRIAGPGYIDTDYLLGANGGHLNVNGAAGRGTKSSFLLWINWLLLGEARRQEAANPTRKNRLRIVPIILNVKNFDLFYIDRRSVKYEPDKHLPDWQAMGYDDPQPFTDAVYYAAQQRDTNQAVPTGRASGVMPYSWSLKDVIVEGLMEYLFAEADANDVNFSALILDIQDWLTRTQPRNAGSVAFTLRSDGPQTFRALLDWVNAQAAAKDETRVVSSHHTATWKKLARRLIKLIYECQGALRTEDNNGNPLDVRRSDTSAPIVVDLAALAGESMMQRFVVATIFKQLVAERTGAKAIGGLIYLVTLDELNRFAPKGAKDPITQLIEKVAAEMRSQGVILLGAQQQASRVSERVIENAGIRVLGKTGVIELAATAWRGLSDSARSKADRLPPDEKLILQDNFREPMHVKVPFPVWAMNPQEALSAPPSSLSTPGASSVETDDLDGLLAD